MKTLYLSDTSANIVVDPEENYVGTIQNEDRYAIRGIYYAEEPMHVVYQSGERKEEIDAKKDDLIIVFYNDRFNKYILDTVRTKQWAANIKNRRVVEQKEKEEWAAKNADLKCGDCDMCCPTACPAFEEAAPRLINDAPVTEKTSKIKEVIKKVKKVVKKA